jgi:tetratricopeptide (TPR) repeat protein
LVQCAAVLGKTFLTDALIELSGLEPEAVRNTLAALARKEILGLQSDPRSPERGQYGFLQDLVKRVAYETVSKRDRRTLHVAAAQRLERYSGEDQDFVEITAFHYLEAFRLAPEGPEADELRGHALAALVKSGERAASLAANEEAVSYFASAFELAEGPAKQAAIAEKAGIAAEAADLTERARELLETAIDLFRSAGLPHDAARCSAKLGEVLWLMSGDLERAAQLMDASLAELADAEPSEDTATLIAQASRMHFFRGDYDIALELADRALEVADPNQYYGVIAEGLNNKSLVLDMMGRTEEAFALLQHALHLSQEHDLPTSLSRARFNLAFFWVMRDRVDQALELDLQEAAQAKLIGNRLSDSLVAMHLMFDYSELGRWDEVLRMLAEAPLPAEVTKENRLLVTRHLFAVPTLLAMGDREQAEAIIAAATLVDDPSDVQWRMNFGLSRCQLLLDTGALELALATADEVIKGDTSRQFFPIIPIALEAAIQLGLIGRAVELLDSVESLPRSSVPRYFRNHFSRYRARLAAVAGDHAAADLGLRQACEVFRELGNPYWNAVLELERAENLAAMGLTADAIQHSNEAREIFERLGAKVLLTRVDKLSSSLEGSVAAAGN